MGSGTWMFSWEAPWHSFSNSEAFLIRDCQSCFSVQSHVVDRQHFPQNIIQSWGLIFLVNSSKPKPLISRKDSSASGKRCLALSKKTPKSKPTNPTPKMNKKPNQKTQVNPHANTHNRLQSLELFLFALSLSWRQVRVFNFLLFYEVQNDTSYTSCLMMFVELTLQAHRLVWIVWNVLETQMIWVILAKLIRLLNLKTVQ